MTAGVISHWLDIGRLDLPLPASGATARRWRLLTEMARDDITAARIAEAHLDAVAILHELGGKPVQFNEVWGVWAAEAPEATLVAEATSDGTSLLNGTKAWCSGASFCTNALVTAADADGQRGLYAVTLTGQSVRPLPSTWANPGMAGSDTRAVQFTNTPAVPVGEPGDYLNRPGFWHGAIGVAACWLGGAQAVAQPLYDSVASGAADEHALAHLGAVDAALTAAEAVLAMAAAEIDADPFDRAGRGEMLARRVRAVAETAVDEAITRTARALGPVPLCTDDRHARRVADLSVYVRQSHAERDLAALGALAGTHR
ncbi:acyl-CoA dehydrogenase family protein [Mycolicibacterium confluentis]|uniref:Acyl-CoA dehydrogenase n=1 Tax=Mycolicibacterium confluentis TaxID=28047 RepID=A0A7I7Y119_9MYCO|nr:acyl-CoA dehydrogenase [Mycolicibacterium confluentis]MCV7320322.1 acyl-CoA dehydrogenase [Mycolicibacterium confluentis]ORV34824.1 acyl-CoA dehydrogenase [Mycolicibacterium confluentis]BBZ35360.1 acyl-CoA dehydrogenase [Mycolicibacterium confluentis]